MFVFFIDKVEMMMLLNLDLWELTRVIMSGKARPDRLLRTRTNTIFNVSHFYKKQTCNYLTLRNSFFSHPFSSESDRT